MSHLIYILLLCSLLAFPACATTPEAMAKLGVNVGQFGAVGDGKADDTAAIQKALDFAFKQGHLVVFPAGSYVISKPLVVPRNVEINGAGLGFTSSIIPLDCDAFWLKGETQEGGYAFRNKIQNLTINMRRSTSGKAIVVDRAYNIKLADIFIYDAPATGIYINSSKHISLDNVIVYGSGNKKGIGIKVTDSIVNMYNIDLENSEIALEIGPNKQEHTPVSVFGGFIERFGKYGINIIKSSHNTFIGLNIQADSEEKFPLSIDNNSADAGRLENSNTFIGGYIGYSRVSPAATKSQGRIKLENGNNVIGVGE